MVECNVKQLPSGISEGQTGRFGKFELQRAGSLIEYIRYFLVLKFLNFLIFAQRIVLFWKLMTKSFLRITLSWRFDSPSVSTHALEAVWTKGCSPHHLELMFSYWKCYFACSLESPWVLRRKWRTGLAELNNVSLYYAWIVVFEYVADPFQ